MSKDSPTQPRSAADPAPAPARPAPGSPVAFAALRHKGFRAYFVTAALAMMADNIEHVISYWVLFEKFHSPALAGVAVLTHWLPFLFFSVYFGAVADRFDRRRIIQIAQAMYMAVSLGWGLLFLTDALEVWHAVVLLTVHGLAGVLWGPAGQVLIYSIVPIEHLQSAVRLNATSRNLGVLLGPAVGGGLLLLFGPSTGLLVNVLLYLPLVWWLGKTPYGQKAPRAAAAPRPPGALADLRDVLRKVSGNPTIVAMLLLTGASSLFVGNAFQAQMPEYAHHLGAADADFRYSVLLGSNAAGALAGGILLESRGLLQASPRAAMVLTFLWCLAITGFAAATSYPLAVALMFVAGFLNLTCSAMAQTLVQLHAPADFRGRVIGLYHVASNGLRAFSGLTVGVLGSLIGIHWSLALSALALLAVTTVLFGLAPRRR